MRASNSSKKKLLGSCRGARNNKPIYRNEIDWFVFLMFFAPLFPPQSCCFCARHSHNLSFFLPLLLSLLCSRFIPPKCVRVESAPAIVFAYQHLFPEKKKEKSGGIFLPLREEKTPKDAARRLGGSHDDEFDFPLTQNFPTIWLTSRISNSNLAIHSAGMIEKKDDFVAARHDLLK